MNIRQVRKKIKSIGNVKKITKAMELVSAVKMRKAQQVAVEGKAYETKLTEIVGKITAKADLKLSVLLQTHTSATKNLVILISTSKGLCGSYNFNLFRHLHSQIDIKNTDFITVGKKGSFFVNKLRAHVLADFSVHKPLDNVTAVFNLTLTNYLTGAYKTVYLAYNEFVSTVRSNPRLDTILPCQLTTAEITAKNPEYIMEPNPETIVDALSKSYIESKIRFAMIQREAGEHSSRMIAMKNATDNATDLIYNLTLLRNKIRQEKITYELLDMVTSKESVEA